MIEIIEDGGPAFPTPNSTSTGELIDGKMQINIQAKDTGLSLRDYFAGQALIGILSGPCSREGARIVEWFDTPIHAYCIADAMLSARKRGENS
jgi:hypothetical protein